MTSVQDHKIYRTGQIVRSRLTAAVLLGLVFIFGATSARADERLLFGGNGRPIHALVIGIDAYQHVRPLKGAAADARDIDSALHRMGVSDVVTLIDLEADRASMLREIDGVLQRTAAGDLVVLSIAGHGAQEPEHVKGSQPDGMDDVFLLPGFDMSGSGSDQRVLGSEFNHFIKEFESRGANVLFVADVCHGGGMVREIDPRAAELSFRGVDRYVLIADALKPISTPAEARMTKLDFKNTTFLAAVDRSTKAPEVRIPGIPGFRGALSYAVARAFEGKADANMDGKVTTEELFEEVHDVVYQLSNQRQNPVTVASPNRENDIAFALQEPAKEKLAVSAVNSRETQKQSHRIIITSVDETAPEVATKPIKIAPINGSVDLSGLERRKTHFQLTTSAADADLAWDSRSGDVIADGDVVAYRAEKADLPSIVDRMAAVQHIKQLLSRSPQTMKVGPDDALHHEFSKVVVEVLNVENRSLILFDIASDGTIQALYPSNSDVPFVDASNYRLPVVVRSPFGADQVVAITSAQRMLALEQVLREFNGRRTPVELVNLIERYAPQDARIGSVGIFTAP
jgi:Caspase domain